MWARQCHPLALSAPKVMLEDPPPWPRSPQATADGSAATIRIRQGAPASTSCTLPNASHQHPAAIVILLVPSRSNALGTPAAYFVG